MIWVVILLLGILGVGLVAGIRQRRWWLVGLTSVGLLVIIGYAIGIYVVIGVLDW